jgi:sugar phosphate isomerase/epimerase
MAKLSAFPKCYMDELCVTKTMTLFEWIDLAASLGVDGVEMYPGFFENFEPEYLERVKNHLQDRGLEAPMMCASPDFTIPDEARNGGSRSSARPLSAEYRVPSAECRVGQVRPHSIGTAWPSVGRRIVRCVG